MNIRWRALLDLGDGNSAPVDNEDGEHALYQWLGGPAESVKIALQMIIGAGIVGLLILKVASSFGLPSWLPGPVTATLKQDTLEIVAHGLMYSAGVELAYMLFTPGPDEAVEPVLLGLASAVLLTISNDGDSVLNMLNVAVMCAAIAGLFYVKDRFLKKRRKGTKTPRG